MTTKTLFRWHLWLGLATGLCLFVIGGSGAIAVFIEEIDWLVTPALRTDAPAAVPRASPDDLVAAVRAAYPADRITSLNLSVRPSFAHVAKVTSKSRGNLDVFLDPISGRIQGDRAYSGAYTSTLRNFIRQLHLRLFMGLWGRVFVGFFGVTLVLSCVTGLWIYRGWIRNLFRLRWRAAGARTRWSDLHKVVGVWSLLFNVMFGVTGAVYGYENLAGQIRSHWLRPRPSDRDVSAVRPAPAAAAGALVPALAPLLESARRSFPDLTVRNILLPANPGAPVVLRGDVPHPLVQQSHVRRASFVSLDPATGAVIRRVDGREARGWARLYSAFDPLHFGYFGGVPTKIAWFIFGMTPSVLTLSGAWLWWRRTRRTSVTAPAIPGASPRFSTAGGSSVRMIGFVVVGLTLACAYCLVARAQGSWAVTGRLIEHALAKPLALALTAFPVTGVLLWLAWRSVHNRFRFAVASLLLGTWYLSLVTLFQ